MSIVLLLCFLTLPVTNGSSASSVKHQTFNSPNLLRIEDDSTNTTTSSVSTTSTTSTTSSVSTTSTTSECTSTSTTSTASFSGSPVPVLIASGFSQPTALAFDSNGNIYVAEDAGETIKEIRRCPDGSFNPTPDIILSGTISNVGLASDQADNLYFTSYYGGTVDKLPVGCRSISCVQTLVNVGIVGQGGDGPRGVSVDSNGYVWYTTWWGGGDSDNGTLRIYFPENATSRVLLEKQNYPNVLSISPDGCAYWGVQNSGTADHIPEVRRYCLGMETYQTVYTFTTECINGVPGYCPELPSAVRVDPSGDVIWSTWGGSRIMMLPVSSTTPVVVLDYRNIDSTQEPEIGGIILDGSGHLYYIIYDVYPEAHYLSHHQMDPKELTLRSQVLHKGQTESA
jgi:hypothetical protein